MYSKIKHWLLCIYLTPDISGNCTLAECSPVWHLLWPQPSHLYKLIQTRLTGFITFVTNYAFDWNWYNTLQTGKSKGVITWIREVYVLSSVQPDTYRLPLACRVRYHGKDLNGKYDLCLNTFLILSVQRELKLFWNMGFFVLKNCFLSEQLFLYNIVYKKHSSLGSTLPPHYRWNWKQHICEFVFHQETNPLRTFHCHLLSWISINLNTVS